MIGRRGDDAGVLRVAALVDAAVSAALSAGGA